MKRIKDSASSSINKELLEALKTLVLAIAPDYRIDDQEKYFQGPLRKALEAIRKAELLERNEK